MIPCIPLNLFQENKYYQIEYSHHLNALHGNLEIKNIRDVLYASRICLAILSPKIYSFKILLRNVFERLYLRKIVRWYMPERPAHMEHALSRSHVVVKSEKSQACFHVLPTFSKYRSDVFFSFIIARFCRVINASGLWCLRST